ncbi:uncharacterized protein LOC121108095 isoform X2 [Gallus gallus]|nr:uncharacterized protein LOC121108095 isoform X2 [Gallus gallus]XP_040515983.1 uncharacterized protein LOC121108095 isoform X2 [Gallus gallus]
MRAFRLCRVGALSAKGTALPGGAVQISTCLPQGAPLPYRPLRDRNSLSNAAAEWPHAFVALPLPLCPKLMGVLGEEWQFLRALLETMEDEAWTKALSCELSQWLSSSPSSSGEKMELDSVRAQATRSALILAHGSSALRASKEQLLAHLEGDIMGSILMLYSCSCWNLLKKYFLGNPVSPVPLKVVLALEQLR